MHTQSDRLVLVAGPGQGQEFVLGSDRLVIGRGEECEVSINHPSVSRVHAEIRRVGEGHWEIVDLSSANGIRVNGSELPNSLLDSRDVIELGDVVLKFLPAGEIYIPGPEEALRLDRGAPGKQGLPFWLKLAVVLALAAGAAVLVMVLRSPEPPPAPIVKAEGTDPIGQLLKDAKAMLAKGDIEGAMQRAAGIPESSNLRASNDYRAIQDAWADSLFDKAAKTQDAIEKRALYDKIAGTASVDPARRKRAADEVEALQKAAVDITELPSAEDATGDAPDAPSEKPDASAKKVAVTPPKTATAAAPKKAPAPATAKTSTPSGSLVRKTPF
jgi:hypothetical protein